MPRLVAKGGRQEVFDSFKTAHTLAQTDFVALLVDSEDPVADFNKPWEHLKQRKEDKWSRPKGPSDKQVFLMTTSMETWIAADTDNLKHQCAGRLNTSKLPKHDKPEKVSRKDMFEALVAATRNYA